MGRALLIVDDVAVLRQYVARVLRREGYEVSEAASAEDALAHLAAADPLPDLVILDVMMPGMDGLAMLSQVRRTPRTAHVPVIMFSALNDGRRVAAALAEGAFGYWVKGSTGVGQIFADVARAIEAGPGAVPPSLGHDPAPNPRRDRDPDPEHV